jgi:DNA-binding transcriptional MerR regulator
MATSVDALTINEAAETTGWSARMLRYIESIGLVSPRRSDSGYRLYGPAELQRLSTLRELLEDHELDLSEVGFALKCKHEPRLREAIEMWLAAEPARPEHVSAANWLRFEQEKHQRLLASAGRLTRTAHPTRGDRSNDDRHAPGSHTSSPPRTESHSSTPTTTMEIA